MQENTHMTMQILIQTCQLLVQAMVLFRVDRNQEAINKLYQTMLENSYLVPFLLGRNPQPLDMWHGSNLEWIEHAAEIPQELLSLWDDAAVQWTGEASGHPAIVEKVARWVAIHRELRNEPRGPRRAALVDGVFRLEDDPRCEALEICCRQAANGSAPAAE